MKRNNILVKKYIIDCINTDSYEVKADSEVEKLIFLRNTFNKEYGHQKNYYKSTQDTFINWCMGLPSSFNIAFKNHEIVELMNSWYGGESTAKEENIIASYWKIIYMEFTHLLRNYNLTI